MRTNPLRSVIAMLLMCCAGAHAQTPACPGAEITGFTGPESVFETPDAIYVSNVGGAAGSNFISKVDKRSMRIDTLRFLPLEGGLDKPLGLLVADGVLYVADLKRVRGYDLKTRAAVFELDIPEAGSLNDFALGSARGGEVWFFVSDYFTNKIFKVYPRRNSYSVFAHVVGANGLTYDAAAKTLYVAGLGGASTSGEAPPYFGALYKVSAQGRATLIKDTGTFLDGIALHRGRLYFSDWGSDFVSGSLHSMPLSGPAIVRNESVCASSMRGPADFTRSLDGKRWLIPALSDNKVLIEPISQGY